jgi:phosphotransferase system HPr (HPr) family protein
MQEIELVIENETGLHLRPAALFVQTAAAYQSDIRVRNVTRASGFQNAKSALGIMMLKVGQGETIGIQAEGSDAAEAITALKQLVESNFTIL